MPGSFEGALVFDAAPTALVVVGERGVVAANDACGRLLSCDATTLVDDGLARLLDEPSRDALAKAIGAALAGGGDGGSSRDDDPAVLRLEREPGRYLSLRFGMPRGDCAVGELADVSAYFHSMMLLAYSANTTMVIDPAAEILWGPVGRYAAQEFDSPWYGRGEANPLGWLHPEDMGRVLQAFAHVLDNPGVVHELTVRTRHVILEDQWGTAMIRAINLIDDPLVGGVLIQTHAEGEEHKVSLGRTTGSFHSIAESAPIGIILSDHLGRALYFNEVARDLFELGPTDRSDGATDDDVDWPSLARASQVDELRELLAAALDGATGKLTARFSLPSGSKWLTVEVAPQLNDVGEPMGWLATLVDITFERAIQEQLESTQERLIHLALHDPLTELANRRMFADQLARAIARSARDKQRVALLFCDLDGFKPVNDAHGHDTGDRVLEEVAARLLAGIRTNDLAARLGGDEFVVLVEGFGGVDEVEVVAARLVDVLAAPITITPTNDEAAAGATPFTVGIGVSIGIAIATPDDSPDSLLSRADDLMYQAKAAGKGRYVLDAHDN